MIKTRFHHGLAGLGKLVAVLTTAAAALGTAVTAQAQTKVVFDNITPAETSGSGASLTTTGSTPNTFMGDGYNLISGTTSITGFDYLGYNGTTTAYTGLQINVYVWGSVNTGTVSASAPAFSNLLGSYTFTSTGTFATSSIIDFESATPGSAPALLLPMPLIVPGTTVGVTFSLAGTTGTTYATANNLTSIITYGAAPTTGTDVFNGYFRNANSETNGNFTSATRSLGQTNQSLSIRVFGVPEPGTWAMIFLATVLLLAWQFRRRTALA